MLDLTCGMFAGDRRTNAHSHTHTRVLVQCQSVTQALEFRRRSATKSQAISAIAATRQLTTASVHEASGLHTPPSLLSLRLPLLPLHPLAPLIVSADSQRGMRRGRVPGLSSGDWWCTYRQLGPFTRLASLSARYPHGNRRAPVAVTIVGK